MRKRQPSRGFAILATLAFAAATNPARALDDPPSVVVSIIGAEALEREADTVFGNEQDPFPRVGFGGALPVDGPILNGSDVAWWEPPFTRTFLLPGAVREQSVQIQLIDDDDTSADDPFDINPGPTRSIDLRFDTCLLTWTAEGVDGAQGAPSTITGAGSNPARIHFDVRTGDGRPLTTDDVAIARVTPVQAVFDPFRVVAGKPLAFRVDLVSTFGESVTAPVTVTLKDNDTGGERAETRTVTVPPTGTTVYFFDGSGSETPYVPGRNATMPDLIYSVVVNLAETVPPGTDPKFLDCWSGNNRRDNRRLPIIATSDPFVVYLRWDWDYPILVAPPSWIPQSQLATFRQREETFRLATWPLAQTNPANLASTTIGLDGASVSPGSVQPDVGATLALAGAAASVGGIDRLVLVTRQGWFQQNAAAGAAAPSGAIGVSLSEAAPHAVIAEDGYFDIAVHELGHTYMLSRRNCSNGGLAESVADHGCRDEYQHPAGDGRPYEATGYDVGGTVYPSSYTSPWPGLVCPPVPFGAREVCAANFMDATPSTSYQNWIDNLSYESLASDLKSAGDPELVNLTGWVHTPGGLENATHPPVFTGEMFFSYHFLGVPDEPQPPMAGSTAGSGPFSGGGPFAVRLDTGQGSRTYRFNPAFRVPDFGDREYAYFSFNVPWEPTTRWIRLYGPADIEHTECEIAPCATSEDVLLFTRERTQASPEVTTLRAGRDEPPSLAGPQPEPPTIGPGHDVVLAWDRSDLDSPELRSAVLIDRAPGSGGPLAWDPMGIELQGNTLRIAHVQLADWPGEYVGRVVLSDGVNSTTYTSPAKIFRICNFTSGGIEACNGIDDDCDGVVDNVPLINGQPWLSLLGVDLSWTQRCDAQVYDVSRGSLAAFASDRDFRSATCLAPAHPSTTLADPEVPPVGGGFWYLVRAAGEIWSDGTEVADRNLTLVACP